MNPSDSIRGEEPLCEMPGSGPPPAVTRGWWVRSGWEALWLCVHQKRASGPRGVQGVGGETPWNAISELTGGPHCPHRDPRERSRGYTVGGQRLGAPATHGRELLGPEWMLCPSQGPGEGCIPSNSRVGLSSLIWTCSLGNRSGNGDEQRDCPAAGREKRHSGAVGAAGVSPQLAGAGAGVGVRPCRQAPGPGGEQLHCHEARLIREGSLRR